MNEKSSRRRFNADLVRMAAASTALGAGCWRMTEYDHGKAGPMSENPLWSGPEYPLKHPERLLELGRRAMAGREDPIPVPIGQLDARDTTKLSDEITPGRLLVGDQCVVVCSGAFCQVIGPLGKARAELDSGASGLCLDRTGAHLLVTGVPRYAGDREQELQSRRMPGGSKVGYVYTDPRHEALEIHRFDDLYLICSVAPRPRHSNSKAEAGAMLIHAPSLGLPGIAGRLADVHRVAFSMSYGASMIRAGAGPSGPVFATDRGVQWKDWALRPTVSWPMECRPLAFAVGRSGDAALVAVIHREAWLVAFDADGTERFRVQVPQSHGDYGPHVIVNDDGGVVLSPTGYLLAFDRAGSRRWAKQRDGINPAVLLADGHVMFGHRTGLWVADPDGTAREVWRGPAPLETSPVAHGGRWWVATADTLYELG